MTLVLATWISCLFIADLAFRRKLSTMESPSVRMARAMFAGALPQILLAPWMEARLIVWVWLIAAAYYGLSSTRASFTAYHHAGRSRAVEAWVIAWAALLVPLSYLVWLLGSNHVLSVKQYPITGMPEGLWRFGLPALAAFLLASTGARLLAEAMGAALRGGRGDGGPRRWAAANEAGGGDVAPSAEDPDGLASSTASAAARTEPDDAMQQAMHPVRTFREARRAREATAVGLCGLVAGVAAGGQGAVLMGAALVLASAWRTEPIPRRGRHPSGTAEEPLRPRTPHDRGAGAAPESALASGIPVMRGRAVGPTLVAATAGIAAAGWLRWVMTLPAPM